jgi:2-(3-amino-3-carboxypropyl)histidine synthase
MTFNFETDYLIEELKKRKPKKVLVQLPEGVKQNAFEIANIFQDLNIETVFSGETCWGACSVGLEEALAVKADLIVHFGHAEFVKVDFPVLYVEVRDELNLKPWLEKSLDNLKDYKKIGLSYSIQHRHDIENVVKFYKDNGKEVLLSEKLGNVAYEGHIVGCQYSGLKAIEDKVDCFVILGNNFHSMGAVMSVEKPVFLIDVYNDKITNMEGVRDKILKERWISIEKFKEAKNIGVIVESKIGQKFGAQNLIIKKLKAKGKNVILITMNELSPDKLMNFYHTDCFVELACPRIAIDDYAKYQKPILTFKEALVGLGDLSWEDFLSKGAV